MMPSAVESFKKAFFLTREMLFKPFNIKKLFKLGFINIFVGMGGGGTGGNFNFNPGDFTDKKDHNNFNSIESLKNLPQWIKENSSLVVIIITALAVLGTVFLLFLMWLTSVFNFVFLENVIKNQALIREPFNKLKSRGTSYFLFNLAFLVIILTLLLLLIVAPIALFGHAKGALGVVGIVFGVIYLFFAFLLIIFSSLIIAGLTKDFVLPVMYFENIKIKSGWKKYFKIFKENFNQTLIYLLLKIAVWIGGAIYSAIAAIIVLLVLGIPALVLGLVLFFGAKALLIGWTALTVTVVVILGSAWLIAFMYLFSCLVVPVEVYRRFFALHFLGTCREEWKCLS